MKYVLLLIISAGLTGCCSYPTFNLREPVYIIPKSNFLKKCRENYFESLCLKSLADGTGSWFKHLPPEKRPKIVVTNQVPQKTKNEIIFVDVDHNINNSAHFEWSPRPLKIVLKKIYIEELLLDFYFAHEFGHAIVGGGHNPNDSISIMTEETIVSYSPTPKDIENLHKKHPELSR